MNITINTQVLSGNLGDGWSDNNAAAEALAEYTEKTWLADLADQIVAGHDVAIDIDVALNTSGCSREMSVNCGNDEDAYEMMESIKSTLTDEGVIWERFCSSDEAKEFYA